MALKDSIQCALHQLSDVVEASFKTGLPSTTLDAADLKVSGLRKAFRALEAPFCRYLAEINDTRNAATPVYRLPNEVLVIVINYVLIDCGKHIAHNADTLEYSRYKELSNLGMVSRRWYSVVTKTPSLWTIVPLCGHPTLLSTIATRSGTLPLRIEGRIVAYNEDEEVALSEETMKQAIRERIVSLGQIIGPHFHRWQTVDLDLLWFSLQPLGKILEEPAPSVRSVSLKVDVYHSREFGILDLFAGRAENLRHIKLERVRADWGSAVFCGLTTLALSDIWGNDSPRTSHLLEMLRGSPGLEKLSLRNVELDHKAEWQESTMISMKQLRELVLSSYQTGMVQYIVRHIRDLDNCKTMNIDFMSNGTMEVSSLQATFAHLPSTMERIFSPPKRLVVQIPESRKVTISRLFGDSSFSFEGQEGTAESVITRLPTMLNPSCVNIPVHLQVNAREKLSTLSHIRLLNVVLLEVTRPPLQLGENDSHMAICCRPLLKILGGFQPEGWEEGPAFPRLKKFRVNYMGYTGRNYVDEVVEMVSNRYSAQNPPGLPKFKVSLRRATSLIWGMKEVGAIIGQENVLVHGAWDKLSLGWDPEKDPGEVYQCDPATEFDNTLEDSSGELEDE